jgi:hypothetical protein
MIKVTIANDPGHMLINKFDLILQLYNLSNLLMIIYQHFTFDAAHFLPHVPDRHKSAATCMDIPITSPFTLPAKYWSRKAGSWIFPI